MAEIPSRVIFYNTKSELFLDYKKALTNSEKSEKLLQNPDVEIVQEIMNKYKNQYQ